MTVKVQLNNICALIFVDKNSSDYAFQNHASLWSMILYHKVDSHGFVFARSCRILKEVSKEPIVNTREGNKKLNLVCRAKIVIVDQWTSTFYVLVASRQGSRRNGKNIYGSAAMTDTIRERHSGDVGEVTVLLCTITWKRIFNEESFMGLLQLRVSKNV